MKFRKGPLGLASLIAFGLLALLGAGAPAASAADPCPNAAAREQQGATMLADCRAWEMVSYPDKNGNGVAASADSVQISPDGRRVFYGSRAPFALETPSAPGFVPYVATRNEAAQVWSTAPIMPPIGLSNGSNEAKYRAISADVTRGVLRFGGDPSLLDPGSSSQASVNEYLVDFTAPAFNLLTPALSDFFYGGLFGEASPSLEQVVIQSETALVPAVQGKPVEWGTYLSTDGGAPRLVGLLPGDVVPDGGSKAPVGQNVVSEDGSRVFFGSPYDFGTGSQLYVRVGGETQHVNASTLDTPDPQMPARFEAAGTDGRHVFFTSCERLTEDSTADANGGTSACSPDHESAPATNDLYRYDTAAESLVDITTGDPAGADVLGLAGQSGSESGDRLYFVARGVLDGGAISGQPNLYLWEADETPNGEVAFIATLDPGDGLSFSGDPGDKGVWSTSSLRERLARVTPDGRYLTFMSKAPLEPGFDNAEHHQVFLFDAEATADPLVCVSCGEGAGPATADAGWRLEAGFTTFFENSDQANFLSDDGESVFFETARRLEAVDTNGKFDVYEYDTASSGLSLVTSGRSDAGSYFTDATPDGSSVLVTTTERIAKADGDDLRDLYVARAGGGLTEPDSGQPPCEEAECLPEAFAPPLRAAPSTATFSGRGNVTPGRACGASTLRARKAAQRARRLGSQAKRPTAPRSVRKRAAKAKRKSAQLRRRATACRRAS